MDGAKQQQQIPGTQPNIASLQSGTDPATSVGSSSRSRGTNVAISRRLLPLLPKPAIDGQGLRVLPKKLATSRTPARCGIRQCERKPCLLESHRRFVAAQQAHAKLSEQQAKAIEFEPIPRKSSLVSDEGVLDLHLMLRKDGGFPNLPLDESEQLDPVLRQLFHDFFAKLIHRLHNLIVPPFTGYFQWAEQRQQALFQDGVSKRLDCLNFLGASYVYFSIRSHRLGTDHDRMGIMLHSNMMKCLRDVLANYDPAKDVESVLSIIFTLVMAEMNANIGRSTSTLLAHRAAMIRIVESRGGLHNCGYSVRFTASLDRVIATHTEMPPLYTSWESLNLPIQRAPLYSATYGEFFETDPRSAEINRDIVGYCMEVCRAIEILEGENWNFDGLAKSATPEIFYFYFLQERVAGKFAHLNARYRQVRTRERCVLLAAKIVEYMVLLDNYVAPVSMAVANRLRQLLTEQDLPSMWLEWKDTFRWVTFVLASMPDFWDGKEWALELCCGTLRQEYDGVWPLDWARREQENVRKFVWSTTRLDNVIQMVFKQLQSTIRDDATESDGSEPE